MIHGFQTAVALASLPSPCEVAPSTESQCWPGAGGLPCGHLNSPSTRAPPRCPLRKGTRPTLKTVPRGKPATDKPSRALAAAGKAIGEVKVVVTHNPFAVNDLWFAQALGYSLEKMNPFGCSLVYGHPQGPTGLRGIVELVHARGELVQVGAQAVRLERAHQLRDEARQLEQLEHQLALDRVCDDELAGGELARLGLAQDRLYSHIGVL